MRFLIVSGGYPPEEKMLRQYIDKADILIGVDGAADFLEKLGITAEILIGDFDTADEKNVDAQAERGAKTVRLESEKNESDTEAAVSLAIEAGASEIVLLGAIGSRMDHTMANIALMKQAYDRGISIKIHNANNEIFISKDKYMILGRKGQTVSILPLGGDIYVSATGLSYPLDNLLLAVGSSRGVSNIVKDDEAKISISGGYALILFTNDI